MTLADLDPGCSAITAALVSIAPPIVTVAARRINAGDVSTLWPEELAAVRHAVPKRQREFATGRVLLRQLLHSEAPIPVRSDRTPNIPSEFVVSLAHDDTFVVGAVSRRSMVHALGIDIEPTEALGAEVAALIVRPDETGMDAHLAFTLKEAAYKAWSANGGRLLDHHDVRLIIGEERFTAEVIGDVWGIDGKYAKAENRWLAVAVMHRRDCVGAPGD